MYYFEDDEHLGNFVYLMERYNLVKRKDVQYESMIYIAALPRIYYLINIDNLDSFGPLTWYLNLDEASEKGHKVAAITGSTKQLIELAISLYNGYSISLDELFSFIRDEETLKIIFQAMKIRAHGKPENVNIA